MEQIYNCRRYQYESGEHITFYKRPITIGKETDEEEEMQIEITNITTPEEKEILTENDNAFEEAKEKTEEERTRAAELHSIRSSNNRAKNNVYRIARSNTWDWFITLTFDRNKTDASDYDLIIYRLKVFLNHLQQRKCPDMKYLIVAELHADKEHYHFHGLLANVDALHFRYWKTDKKKNLPIYNITDWKHGYTTATRVQDTSRVSSYITKYICKDVDHHLKEKRRYYYSRSCNVAEKETFLLDEEEFQKIYADRITYVKTVEVPQACQIITYYELKY